MIPNVKINAATSANLLQNNEIRVEQINRTYFYLENMYEVWFGSNCIEWVGYKWKYTHE